MGLVGLRGLRVVVSDADGNQDLHRFRSKYVQSLKLTCPPNTLSRSTSPIFAPSARRARQPLKPRSILPSTASSMVWVKPSSPAVLFSTQLRNSGAGLPDGWLLPPAQAPAPRRRTRTAAEPGAWRRRNQARRILARQTHHRTADPPLPTPIRAGLYHQPTRVPSPRTDTRRCSPNY